MKEEENDDQLSTDKVRITESNVKEDAQGKIVKGNPVKTYFHQGKINWKPQQIPKGQATSSNLTPDKKIPRETLTRTLNVHLKTL